mmetsp:Transcript_28423/g.65025  ORF Transcript_28423/g.65025 Transcript_28423/m.65025 type:complete len:120 (-) Transcript_28423:312-671(-)
MTKLTTSSADKKINVFAFSDEKRRKHAIPNPTKPVHNPSMTDLLAITQKDILLFSVSHLLVYISPELPLNIKLDAMRPNHRVSLRGLLFSSALKLILWILWIYLANMITVTTKAPQLEK